MRRMPLSLLVAVALLMVAIASLGSLSYPLFTIPLFRTDTVASTSTSNSAYWSTISTTIANWVPYSTSTGQSISYNLVCDPASMECTPTATYYITQTLSEYQAHTQISQVTTTTQWVSTEQFESTHTDYGKIPAYAAMGMSDSQFLILAAIVIFLVALGVIGTFLKTQRVKKSHQVKSRGHIFCVDCGAQLPSGSRFCGKCGTEQS